jgi:MbtH protein
MSKTFKIGINWTKSVIVLVLICAAFSFTVMAQEDKEDNRVYIVVVNHEEQYSIFPADKELPLGWKKTGFQGTKAECLNNIKEVWTDMRPLSLRKKMEAPELIEAQTPKPPESVKPKSIPETPKPEETTPVKPAPEEAVEKGETIRLFVGNLSLDTTEDALRELFEESGEVKSVLIETDEDGNSKGTAYIEMSVAEAKEAVSKLNGKELDGKKIVVKKPE